MEDSEIKALFADELMKDETILWVGQPTTKKVFTGADIVLVPFSLFWGGFAIFWEVSTLFLSNHVKDGVGFIFPLFGIPFVLIGLYFMFGRFIYKKFKKQKTFYAVTNHRVLVLDRSFGKNLQGQYINQISSINKTVDSQGIGTITFGNIPFMGNHYGNTGMDFFVTRYNSGIIAFYDIMDADNIYQQINALRKG